MSRARFAAIVVALFVLGCAAEQPPAVQAPAPVSAPASNALDCSLESDDGRGTIQLLTASPVAPSQTRHDPVAGVFVVHWNGQTKEGRFNGIRNADYMRLELTLISVGWMVVGYEQPPATGWLKEPEGAAVPRAPSGTVRCDGPLVRLSG